MVPHPTPEQFLAAGQHTLALIADYWRRLQSPDLSLCPPIKPRVEPGQILANLPALPPLEGKPNLSETIDQLFATIEPGLTHWQAPNFFAYFPCNISSPAVIGELLAAGLGVNAMLWATSPAATELENRMLDWMANSLALPPCFHSTHGNSGGVIQSTASEATLCAMLAARQRWRKNNKPGPTGITLYTSQQSHSSVVKAAMIAGLAEHPDDTSHIKPVNVDQNFALDAKHLEHLVRQDRAAGKMPIFCCATLGTTGTMAFDPLDNIHAALCQENLPFKPWIHVDAAMAGAAWICPEFRDQHHALHHADSIAFNPHKWLLTNFDCDLMWTKDVASLTGALEITPEYLRTNQQNPVIDYRDWGVPLGRRFRALKLYLVFQTYGIQGLQAYIRSHTALANLAFQTLSADKHLQIMAPKHPSSPLIVFRIRPDHEPQTPEDVIAINTINQSLLHTLNATGQMLLSHTTLPPSSKQRHLPPTFVLRMAIGSTFANEAHLRASLKTILQTVANMKGATSRTTAH